MPISSSEIALKYSTKAGTAGNVNAGTALTSLGRNVSTTEVQTATLYNAFPTLTGDANVAQGSEFRCFFYHNKNGSLPLKDAKVWLSDRTTNSTKYTIGVDTNPASAVSATSAQAISVASTGVAPAGVTFFEPLSKVEGLSIGDIPSGFVRAIWVQRKANNTAALAADIIRINIEGDTGA